MSLERVGFFRELRHGDENGPFLREAVRSEASEDESRMISYLTKAGIIATTGMMVHDVLDPDRKDVAVLEIATDGVWAWPTDLPYYLATYHVALPEPFIQHMRSQGWRMPNLDQNQLIALSERL